MIYQHFVVFDMGHVLSYDHIFDKINAEKWRIHGLEIAHLQTNRASHVPSCQKHWEKPWENHHGP